MSIWAEPAFAAVSAPDLYGEFGLHAVPVAEDPVVDLDTFSLSGKRRASIRHSVSSARRAGIRVRTWDTELAQSALAMSESWLATKRGGELDFTLGRFDPDSIARTDCRVAVDADGTVVALATWHRYEDGRDRVHDLMRRAPDAPNPAIDVLIAESLLDFASHGVERASLGSVPVSHGSLAEWIFPTRSLHRYEEKFAPEWQPRFLVCPSRCHERSAQLAITCA